MAEVRRRHDVRLKARTRRILWIVAQVCSSLVIAAAQRETAPDIVVNPGRYSPYYHMRFDITAAAVDFSRTDRSVGSGGMFAIRVRRASFPVPAPSCRGDLILRMPWTGPGPEADQKIAAKAALLERILALERAGNGVVPVVLELNPYVRAISRSPLTLQLTQCNVFFRQVDGAYMGDTDARPRR